MVSLLGSGGLNRRRIQGIRLEPEDRNRGRVCVRRRGLAYSLQSNGTEIGGTFGALVGRNGLKGHP